MLLPLRADAVRGISNWWVGDNTNLYKYHALYHQYLLIK